MENQDSFLECVNDGFDPCEGEIHIRALAVAYEVPSFCEKHWGEICDVLARRAR